MPSRVMLRPGARVVVAAGVALVCLLALYRVQLGSGFTRLFGDWLDTRIAVALEQHWLNVLTGAESWQNPVYFAPSADVLGYNDGYLLYGLLYSALRAIGLDPFLANEALGALFRAAGFAGFLLFARLVCRQPFGWALLGAAVFTLSNGMNVQATHMQLSSVALAPWLGLLMWRSWQAPSRRGRAGWAFLAASLTVCWLMTAFYTVWFAGLFGLVLAGMAAACFRPRMRRLDWVPLLPAALVLVIGLAVFVATYLPKARETGMHSFADVVPFLPAVFDLIHVGPDNWLFGWLDAWITRVRPDPPSTFELAVGFPPVFAGPGLGWGGHAMVPSPLCGCLVVAAGRPGRGSLPAALPSGGRSLALAAGVRRGAGGRCGAGRLALPRLARLPCRVAGDARPQPGCPTLAKAADRGSGDDTGRGGDKRRGGAAAGPARRAGDAARRAAAAGRLPALLRDRRPACCRISSARSGTIRSPSTWDAMLVAEMLRLPTFNGHASFLPPHFGFSFHDPAQYAASARDAVLGSGLEAGTCGLDLQRSQWSQHVVAVAALPLGQPVTLGGAATASAYVLGGWSGVEAAGRWTQGDLAEIAFAVPNPPADLVLTMQASAFPGPGGQASPVRVVVNGRTLARWKPIAAPQTLSVRVPPGAIGPGGVVRLRLVIERPVSPFEMGISPDHRPLGLFVERFQVDRAAPG